MVSCWRAGGLPATSVLAKVQTTHVRKRTVHWACVQTARVGGLEEGRRREPRFSNGPAQNVKESFICRAKLQDSDKGPTLSNESQSIKSLPASKVVNQKATLPKRKPSPRPLTVLAALFVLLAPLLCIPGLAQAAAEAAVEHAGIGKRIAATLRGANWPDEAILFAISMLPVVELRGAIPVGHWMGLHPLYTYALAVAGNMVPVPLILRYIGSMSTFLAARSETARNFFEWLFARTRSKADLLVKYRTLGLILFVAVPLPLTGAWSGAIGAYLLDLPFWESVFANLIGVMGAGVIMTVLCQMGWLGAVIAGVAVFLVASGAFLEAMRKTS